MLLLFRVHMLKEMKEIGLNAAINEISRELTELEVKIEANKQSEHELQNKYEQIQNFDRTVKFKQEIIQVLLREFIENHEQLDKSVQEIEKTQKEIKSGTYCTDKLQNWVQKDTNSLINSNLSSLIAVEDINGFVLLIIKLFIFLSDLLCYYVIIIIIHIHVKTILLTTYYYFILLYTINNFMSNARHKNISSLYKNYFIYSSLKIRRRFLSILHEFGQRKEIMRHIISELRYPSHKDYNMLCHHLYLSQGNFMKLEVFHEHLENLQMRLNPGSLQNIMNAYNVQGLIDEVKKHDEKLVTDLVPLLKRANVNVNKCLDMYCENTQNALDNWWEQPAQKAIKYIIVGDKAFQEWMSLWTLAVIQLKNTLVLNKIKLE
ncbi:hypothetical protein GQR58_010018 [Nymphon striatum]|nr:hypothetical protein GQR58_010018 [Nymphon striatum]